jgi:hypothetical protein
VSNRFPSLRPLIRAVVIALLILALAGVARAQTIHATLTNIPTAATRVVVLVDGGNISVPTPSSQTISTGTSSLVMSIGVPAGGPYRLRVATEDASANLLRSGKVTGLSVTAGQTVPVAISLTDVTAALDASSPTSANESSPVTIRFNLADAGNVLSEGASECWIDWGTDSSSLTNRKPGDITVSTDTSYQCATSLSTPPASTSLYYRVGTYAYDFLYSYMYPLLLYPSSTPLQMTLSAANTISLTVLNIPTTATRLVVLIDGGTLSTPAAASKTISGVTSASWTLGVPSGGTYRVRVLAHDSSYKLLRGGQTTSTGGAASITLSDVAVAVDASTPSSVNAGSQTTIKLNITDAGSTLETGAAECWIDYGTSSSSLSSRQYGTLTATSSTVSQCAVSLTVPSSGTTLYYQLGDYAIEFVYEHLSPLLSWPSSTPQTISLTSGGIINLTLSSIPSTATRLVVAVDGGSLTTPVVASQTISAGTSSFLVSVSVAAGGPYRVRAIATDASATILRSGKTSDISVSGGGSATASITLGNIAVALNSATPSSASPGVPVTITVDLTDPGDFLGVGDGYCWLDYGTDSSDLSESIFGTVANVSGSSYQGAISLTTPANSPTLYYQFGVYAPDFIADGLTPIIAWPAGSSLQMALLTTNPTIGTDPVGLTFSVDSTTYTSTQTFTWTSGGTHTLAATSPQNLSGTSYTFSSWSDGGAATHTITVPSPPVITARYAAASPVSFTVTSSPPGLTISVDGTSYLSPVTLSWSAGSSHTIATTATQSSGDTRYVFSNWSDAGALSHTITAPSGTTTYTAQFTTQYLLSTAVSPSGGGTIAASPSSTDGYYTAGTSVQLTASAGTGYQFSAWSGALSGTTNPQTLSMSAARSVTATFAAPSGITIATNPAGLAITVDSVAYVAPQTFSWTAGSTHTISSSSPQGSGTRYVFSSWSDAGALSHTITTPSAATTYTAQFTTQYLLTTAVSPSGAGSVSASPTSANGYYTAGTSVQLTATPGSAYSFISWSGDVTSTSNPQSLSLTAPKSVTANFGSHRPAVVSVNPASGASLDQVFTFTYSDSYGYAYLDVMNVLINTNFGTASACYLAYNRSLNVIYLLDNAGTGLLTGVTPGSSLSASNSQCTIYGSGSSATGSGTNLTLKLHLGFTQAFMGVKSVFAAATDTVAASSGWQTMGTWTVTPSSNSAPVAVSASPTAGQTSASTFTFTFSDADSYRDLSVMNILINNFLDGRHACYVAYSQPLNTLYLVNDTGDGLLTALPLNGSGSVGNSQCTINGTGSSVTTSGNTLTLKLSVTFTSSFAGNKIFYLAARDLLDNNSGWQALGTWTVPPLSTTSPSVNGMFQGRSSGNGMRFSFYFGDTKGWQDLGVVNVLLNNSLDGRQACYLAYSLPLNVLYLVNDAGSGLLPGILLTGSGTLSNSQCTVTNPTVSGSGNTMILSLMVTFPSGFAGNRVWYLAARDVLENSSGWQAVGSYTVTP